MHPDWLGSPQHVLAGLLLAAFVAEVAARVTPGNRGLTAIAAVAVTMGVEALVELAEYPILYQHRVNQTAYFDTIADIASTLAGAITSALMWLLIRRRTSSA